MKEVFLISSGPILGSKTAGSRRMITVAKSLGEGGANVFLCSYQSINKRPIRITELSKGVFYIHSTYNTFGKPHLAGFVNTVYEFIKKRNSEKVIYLYPTVFVIKDLFYLLYFKMLRRMRFFCEINELRITNIYPVDPAAGFLKKFVLGLKYILDFFMYKMSEYQALFYNGVVVISKNLEKHFLKYTRRLLRVPVLCDMSLAEKTRPVLHYDNTIFRICFAGSIDCRKEGFELFFNALSTFNITRHIELYLYGILLEKDRKELERLKKTYALTEKVFYVGNLDPDKLMKEFAGYHLLVVPRQQVPQTKYGFSSKLSEYLISGIPVLLTDVSDNGLYIKDGINGFMVSPGSAIKMAEKISEIIESYNNVAGKIADNAFETARTVLDYKIYSRSLIDFFYSSSVKQKN